MTRTVYILEGCAFFPKKHFNENPRKKWKTFVKVFHR